MMIIKSTKGIQNVEKISGLKSARRLTEPTGGKRKKKAAYSLKP